jgi:RND family efflux transporter MFP subunit
LLLMGSRRWIKWGLIALVVAVVAASAVRALMGRNESQRVAASVPRAQALSELATTDVVRARTRELAEGLPISGSLKAANSAFVKARVAGELQGLLVREGDIVKAGQVLARVDPAEYLARGKQAQEQADSAKAQIDIAQRQYDNNKALVDQGFISRTALDASLSNLASAQANHKAALAALEVTAKAIDDTVLRAPISGLISQRLAQPGERVAIDAKVVEIVDLSRIELEATLSPTDSMAVRIGQTALLQIEGTPQPVAARVIRVSPAAQAGSRSVLTYLSVDNASGLRQGLFAQGTLGTGRRLALAVPLSAVRTDKPAPYLQLVQNQLIVHAAVELGARGEADGEAMVEVKGIAEGALVVAGAVGPVREGTPVKFTGAGAGTSPPAAAASAAARP